MNRFLARPARRTRWLATLLIVVVAAIAPGITTANPVEITYMSWYTGESAALEQQIIDRFNELNPDIHVVKIGGDPRQQLLTMIAGGAPPDVSIINGTTQPHLLADIALDITAYVERAGIDMGAYLSGLADVGIRDGRIYGLPWGFGFFNLMINQTMFNESGLALPQPNWTIEEMTQAARTLTRDATGNGEPDVFGLNPGFLSIEEPLFMLHGAHIVDPETGRTDVHMSAYVDAVQHVSDMINIDRIATTNTFGAVNRRAAFIDGRYAISGEWQSAINWFVEQEVDRQFDWRMVYWPSGRGDQTTLGWGHSVSVIRGTQHPDEAARFVLFWADWEAEGRLATAGVYPQTQRGLHEMVATLAIPSGYTTDQVLGPLLNLPTRPFVPPFHTPGYIESSATYIRPALLRVIRGEAPALTAFQEIRAQVDTLLAQGGQ